MLKQYMPETKMAGLYTRRVMDTLHTTHHGAAGGSIVLQELTTLLVRPQTLCDLILQRCLT